MLPKAVMVKARKAIESLYEGRCTITERKKIKKENKSTGFVDVVAREKVTVEDLQRIFIGDVSDIEKHYVEDLETLGLQLYDLPCRLSFKTINSTNQNDNAASAVVQIVKVFLAPEIKVKPGSKLTITQNDVTTEYKCSGKPAFYSTHQEIVLELFKGWA